MQTLHHKQQENEIYCQTTQLTIPPTPKKQVAIFKAEYKLKRKEYFSE